MKPRSRCRNRFDCGSRLDSFLLPSPRTLGRWANSGTRSATPMRISAWYSAIWRGVDGRMSSPRSTWVIFISASSTGLTKVYNGSPLPRVMREVGHDARGEGRRAAHQVVPRDVLVGHPQPQHRVAALGDEGGALRRRSGRGRKLS